MGEKSAGEDGMEDGCSTKECKTFHEGGGLIVVEARRGITEGAKGSQGRSSTTLMVLYVYTYVSCTRVCMNESVRERERESASECACMPVPGSSIQASSGRVLQGALAM